MSSFFKSDGFFALVFVVALTLVHFNSEVFSTLERRCYDFASSNTTRTPASQVALIAIDEQSIAKLGRWPWSRAVHAKLIDKLASAQASTIVYATFFFEPQVDRGLRFIRQMGDLLTPAAVPTDVPAALPARAPLPAPIAPTAALPGEPLWVSERAQLQALIAQAQEQLDSDDMLAQSIARAGNVLIPAQFSLAESQRAAQGAWPDYLESSLANVKKSFSLPAYGAQLPLANLARGAAGIGHLNYLPDVDGVVRQEALLVNYSGRLMPSLALAAAAASLRLKPGDLKALPDDTLALGRWRIKTEGHGLLHPQFYPAQNGKPAFASDSFFDVLNDKISLSKYRGKLVIIGATAAGVDNLFQLPGNPGVAPAQALAHVVSSILQQHFIAQPAWGDGLTLALCLLLALYLIFVLPRLKTGTAALLSSLLLLALLGSEFALLLGAALWLKLVFPAALLLLGHLALTGKRFCLTEGDLPKSDEESSETHRMMGLALQGQGQLDMAFERFRRVSMGQALLSDLYHLALDFERQRLFSKAAAVYQHMAAFDPDYKDLQSQLGRAKKLAETASVDAPASPPEGTLLRDGSAPMLGRYQLERELGKGAMGVVYQGKDRKIGRVVAIKTMALSQEFDAAELDDARARFFREAQTAGRLQHPNIVSVFDAGEEHDLAYIAMEFLLGSDLGEHCRSPHLLARTQVLSIMARVAAALAYAHQQQVVHRDIKPANIMFDAHSDSVKVTDFGIARMTDSNKTRTGVVLGTPSYMAPEQLAGKKVDGRADLYALGVTLFQLLSGTLPLRAESMTELMHKITYEEAPDLRQFCPDVPAELAALCARLLAKDPAQRYQDGQLLATDLLALAAQATQPGNATPTLASDIAATPDPRFATTIPNFAQLPDVAGVVAALPDLNL